MVQGGVGPGAARRESHPGPRRADWAEWWSQRSPRSWSRKERTRPQAAGFLQPAVPTPDPSSRLLLGCRAGSGSGREGRSRAGAGPAEEPQSLAASVGLAAARKLLSTDLGRTQGASSCEEVTDAE